MHNFKELNSWKEAKDFSVLVYNLISKFSPFEIYEISPQIKRTAVSIPSNIADGADRNTDKYFLRFIAIALCSFKLETQLIIANELDYIENQKFQKLIQKLSKIQKMLVNFQIHLNK